MEGSAAMEAAEGAQITVKSNCNIRKEPSQDAESSGKLVGGQTVTKTGEDGDWINVCFVTTPSGVELYLDNEYYAKSPYGIGDVVDIFDSFKSSDYSQIDNFRIINFIPRCRIFYSGECGFIV